MESNHQNLQYIEEHQAYFHASNLFPLGIFKNLVFRTADGLVECSCKITKGKVHANRFNLWFPRSNGLEQMNTVMDFLAEVEIKGTLQFNRDLLNQFYQSDFDWSRVRRFVVGVDIRENIVDSRLKIWFILNKYHEQIEKAVKLNGNYPDVKNLLFRDELIVGFDFYFDGRTVIKLYPDIQRQDLDEELSQNKIGTILHPTSIELARHAYWLHIYVSDNHKGRILQFHTTTMEPFLKYIQEEEAKPILNLCNNKKLPSAIFAFHEDDIRMRTIQNWSFYYAPQSAHQMNIFL